MPVLSTPGAVKARQRGRAGQGNQLDEEMDALKDGGRFAQASGLAGPNETHCASAECSRSLLGNVLWQATVPYWRHAS